MTAAAILVNSPAPTLRRVRRSEVAKPAFNRPDPYTLLLACWVDYMRTDDGDLGARGMKLTGDGWTAKDVHESQYLADLQVGESVNVMIESLPMMYRWAIKKSQGIATVWRFANVDFGATLLAARDELEQKLREHVATRLYFL